MIDYGFLLTLVAVAISPPYPETRISWELAEVPEFCTRRPKTARYRIRAQGRRPVDIRRILFNFYAARKNFLQDIRRSLYYDGEFISPQSVVPDCGVCVAVSNIRNDFIVILYFPTITVTY